MSIAPPYVIPDTVFGSWFRNRTDHPVYVPFAGEHGMNVGPGERFYIQGDPRVPSCIPRAFGLVESMKMMILAGILEFCSSPAVVIDNNAPDGRSIALFSQDGDPYLDKIPLPAEELEARVLPLIVPTCTHDAVKNEILVDWLHFAGLEIHDKFEVLITPPAPAKTKTIKTGVDKQYTYIVKAGPGDYKFLVTLLAVDGRKQEGTEVTVSVP
jgi:hypothetical protein